MRRATTPTHTFTFPEAVKAEDVTEALVSYVQCGKKVLEKGLDDLTLNPSANAFELKLSQEETDKFAPGKALIQMRIKIGEAALASQMIWLTVKPALNSEEM